MEPNLAKEWVGVLKDIVDLVRPKKVASKKAHPKKVKQKQRIDLLGKTIVVTGTISMNRSEFEKMINEKGATLGRSVTGNTNLLIVGTKPGSAKIRDAKAKRVPFTSWDNFKKRL